MNENTAASAAPPAAPFADQAALDSLQREVTDAAATAAPGDGSGAPVLTAAQVKGEAAMIVGMALDVIGAKVGVTFDAGTKAEGAERLAPVIAKYGGLMPPWLKPYQEELMFGAWCFGVAYKAWQTVQAAKSPTSTTASSDAASSSSDAST